jgi:glycosyltransferase involved in cell wall biosynthesis
MFPCGWAAHLGTPRDIAIEHVIHGADMRLVEGAGSLGRFFVVHLAQRPNAHFHCVSASIEARLHRVAPQLVGRTIVAPMPLGRAIERAKARADIAREPGLFVIASRLVPEKKIERALAFAHSKGARVVLLGQGPEREKLARFAEKQGLSLTLLGARPRDEVFEWMLRVGSRAAGFRLKN